MSEPDVQQTIPTIAMRAAEWCQYTAGRVAPSTSTMRVRAMRLFALYAGYRPLSGQLVLGYVNECYNRYPNAHTLKAKLDPLMGFLKWCEVMGYSDKVYSSLVRIPKQPAGNPLRFSDAQYERLKEYVRGSFWYYAVIAAFRTGMRISDVALLKWESVDMNKCYIHYLPFKTRKTGRHATCPFTPGGDLHQVLLEMNKARNSDPLWALYVCPEMAKSYPKEGPDTGGIFAFHRFSRVITKKLDMPKGLTFHNLRNSFLSRCVDAGIAWPIICQMTGLSSFSTMMAYAKPDTGALHQALDKIESTVIPEGPLNTNNEPPKSQPLGSASMGDQLYLESDLSSDLRKAWGEGRGPRNSLPPNSEPLPRKK